MLMATGYSLDGNEISTLSGPVSVSEQNPHYYSYHGKPVLLITSAEHYGAVVNLDFDYIAYFDRLKEYELNYTRIYPGAYIEEKGFFALDNTLAPEPGRLIVPWRRTGEPGGADGSKFDLEKWDDRYFYRSGFHIRSFQAGNCSRDMLFQRPVPRGMECSAVQLREQHAGIWRVCCNEFQTTLHADWLRMQKAYVRKVVEEVNGFDNVILEICDEPTTKGTPSDRAAEWVGELADVIADTELGLPKKHLIAQQLETEVDFTADDRVSVIVTQYIRHNQYRQVGGVEALDTEYGHNKPIEMNETGYYPLWYDEHKVAASRVEGWNS